MMPLRPAQDLTALRGLADAIHPLGPADWKRFAALWAPVQLPRKALITAAGAQEGYLYFVATGVQRLYYYDDAHREATLLFTYAPSFGGCSTRCSSASRRGIITRPSPPRTYYAPRARPCSPS